MSRSRSYCFTINNYNQASIDDLLFRLVDPVYLVFGKEVGESGTPHLQGFVHFENARSFKALKAALPRAHIEIKSSRSTFAQASEYCKKDGDFHEQGVLPSDPAVKGADEKERWVSIIALAESGDWERIKEDFPIEYGTKLKTLEYLHAKRPRALVEIDEAVPHQWIYGPPGTGKSRTARDQNPGAFIKDPTEKWWDGYDGEDVVIIDDFDKFQVKQGGDMKRWLDRYPFQAQVKGGYMKARPSKVIITSNYHPKEIWDDDVTVKAILRRVELVHLVLPWKPPLRPVVEPPVLLRPVVDLTEAPLRAVVDPPTSSTLKRAEEVRMPFQSPPFLDIDDPSWDFGDMHPTMDSGDNDWFPF